MLAVLGSSLLACAAIVPAAADSGTLSLSVSPQTLTAEQLTHPHALGVTVSCASPLGSVTVTYLRADGVTSTLLNNYPAVSNTLFFDLSQSPAKAGAYVFNATSTGCGAAPPFTVDVTGPDVVTNLLTSPTQLSAAVFASIGVTFDGTGYHPNATLQVASTVPGFAATTVTTDASGAFSLVQTGSAATADGYYSTTFTGTDDGTSYGAFLIGVAPPTTSNPVLSLSTDATDGKITLSQFLSTGVVASATGYAPSDLVIAFDEVDASGNSYLRGMGPPDAAGDFSATLNGTGDLASDRLGVHTVRLQCFLGPDVTGTFEVVPDPVPTITVTPDPAAQGAQVTVSATNLLPSTMYLFSLDGGGGFALATTDGAGSASQQFTLPADYTVGTHTVTALKIGTSTGPPPTGTFDVVASESSTTTTSSTTTSTTTTSTTAAPTTTSSTTSTTKPPASTSTTAAPASTSTTTTTRSAGPTTTDPPTVAPGVAITGGPGGGLAFTGSGTTRGAVLAASLVLAGCACLFVASRRRRDGTSS